MNGNDASSFAVTVDVPEPGRIASIVGEAVTLKTMRIKDAATVVSEALNVPRRKVYQAALAMEKDKK